MILSSPGTSPRTELTFRFRGKTRSLKSFAPRETLLDWLRESEGAKGTKEGCAEGDCGACTVVLARERYGIIDQAPVNACILLLGQIDGAELLTIEDLAEGDTLHPVQQAMVDLHASQCGFCTPGIVMSLFALYHDGEAATRQNVNEALAGNLCRCTGYRPIVDAALATIDGFPNDKFRASETSRLAAIRALDDGRDLFVGDEQSFFAAPASEAALGALYTKHPEAVLLGGATDVGLWVTKRFIDLKKIIWLGRIRDLDFIYRDDEGVAFGAGVRLADAAPAMTELHADLGLLMARFGSAQVRASGTVGGNIANGSPIGDLAPALIAMQASVQLRTGPIRTKTHEEARAVFLEDFFIGYGQQDRRSSEYVYAVDVPRLRPDQAFRAYKVSKRFEEDISAVMGAFRLTLEGRVVTSARVAYGGMAATPKRATHVEAALVGVNLDRPLGWKTASDAIAKDFSPLGDMRASAAYRLEVAGNLIKRALVEISGAAAPTRLGELRAAE